MKYLEVLHEGMCGKISFFNGTVLKINRSKLSAFLLLSVHVFYLTAIVEIHEKYHGFPFFPRIAE